MLLFPLSVAVELEECGVCYSGVGVVDAAVIARAHHASIYQFVQILQKLAVSCPEHKQNQHDVACSLYKLAEQKVYFNTFSEVVIFMMANMGDIDLPSSKP